VRNSGVAGFIPDGPGCGKNAGNALSGFKNAGIYR